MIRVLTILLASVFVLSAANYYVDYDAGSDAANGTSEGTPWKHCPGDPNATGTAAATTPGAGDTVSFNGGVHYRGTITVKDSGSVGNPVIYKSYGTGKGIIDGSEIIPSGDWTKATQQSDVPGNTNWSHFYFATVVVPSTLTTEAGMSLNIYQDDVALPMAQYPTNINKFYFQTNGMLTPDSATTTSITDARLSDLGGDALTNGYINGYYVNSVVLRKLTAYNAGDPSISFASMTAPVLFQVLNVLDDAIFNLEGYAYFDVANSKVFVWPINDADLSAGAATVTYSTNRFGFVGNSKDYVTITNLTICKQTGNSTADSGQVVSGFGTDLTLSSCTIWGQYMNRDNGRIEITADRFVAYSNYIHSMRGYHRTFQLDGVTDATVTNCTIVNSAGTSIYAQGCTNLNFSFNTITNCTGIHANGISPYEYCSNVVIQGNTLIDCNIAITIHRGDTVSIVNNLIDIQDKSLMGGTYNMEWSYRQAGTNLILNNTFVRNSFNGALTFTPSQFEASAVFVICNNILDGVYVEGTDDFTHYSTNNWYLGNRPSGWTSGLTDFTNSNYTTNFINATGGNFNLSAVSVGRNAGASLTGYGYTTDLAGRARVAPWDIGAYEYQPVTVYITNATIGTLRILGP